MIHVFCSVSESELNLSFRSLIIGNGTWQEIGHARTWTLYATAKMWVCKTKFTHFCKNDFMV